jgi:tetratricopeptide (TPR) repeat protein
LASISSALALRPDDNDSRQVLDSFVSVVREDASKAAASARAAKARTTPTYAAGQRRERDGTRLRQNGQLQAAAAAFTDAADLYGKAISEGQALAKNRAQEEPAPPVVATGARQPAPPPQIFPQVPQLLKQAQVLVDLRLFDEARLKYEEVLKIDPNNAAALAGRKKVVEAQILGEVK